MEIDPLDRYEADELTTLPVLLVHGRSSASPGAILTGARSHMPNLWLAGPFRGSGHWGRESHWRRLQTALALRRAGCTYPEIGSVVGCARDRARQLVLEAERRGALPWPAETRW